MVQHWCHCLSAPDDNAQRFFRQHYTRISSHCWLPSLFLHCKCLCTLLHHLGSPYKWIVGYPVGRSPAVK